MSPRNNTDHDPTEHCKKSLHPLNLCITLVCESIKWLPLWFHPHQPPEDTPFRIFPSETLASTRKPATIPGLMLPIALISTDFDGTLVDHDSAVAFPPQLGVALTRFQERGGRWVINTGRSLWHTVEGIELFLGSARPDFIIANEREIYRWEPSWNSWLDWLPWNKTCYEDHEQLFRKARPHLSMVEDWLKRETRAQPVHEGTDLHGIIASNEAEMERILEFISAFESACPDLAHQRNMIYLRFCHRNYSKGTALAHLAQALNIDRKTVFAVGDHQNDLSMLTGEPAALVACPSNAIPEVKTLVAHANGHLAQARCGSGVLEALAEWMPELVNDLLDSFNA